MRRKRQRCGLKTRTQDSSITKHVGFVRPVHNGITSRHIRQVHVLGRKDRLRRIHRVDKGESSDHLVRLWSCYRTYIRYTRTNGGRIPLRVRTPRIGDQKDLAGVAYVESEEVIRGIIFEVVQRTNAHDIGTKTKVAGVERQLGRPDVCRCLAFNSNALELYTGSRSHDHAYVECTRWQTIDGDGIDPIYSGCQRLSAANPKDRLLAAYRQICRCLRCANVVTIKRRNGDLRSRADVAHVVYKVRTVFRCVVRTLHTNWHLQFASFGAILDNPLKCRAHGPQVPDDKGVLLIDTTPERPKTC